MGKSAHNKMGVMMLASKALSLLPKSPNGIYHLFRILEIKGIQGIGNSCPLANYLHKCGVRNPFVGISRVDTTDGWFDLTPAAATFRLKFDRGDYPRLEL